MSSTALPYRQLSRLTTEMYVSFNDVTLQLFPNRFAEAIVFLVIARTCAADWTHRGAICVPAKPHRSISVNAVATSLYRSVETTRRHVNWLIDQDFVVRTPTGVALSPSLANAARTTKYIAAYHDLFLRLVAEIDETCDMSFDDTGAPPLPVDILEVVSRAMDVALVPLSTEGTLVHDVVSMLVWITIGAANIRHVTYDPLLARRYAIESSPDELRRSTSLHAIASAIGLPYATVWRKARALEKAKLLARSEDGWIILTAHLRAEDVEATVTSTTNYILRKIRELVKLGLRPYDLGNAWIAGRAELTPLQRRTNP